MKNIVAYIRGGLGDVWAAVSAIKVFAEERNIHKRDILIFTDSVYYFKENYPPELAEFSIQMLRKITNNIITIHPLVNNNFWLEKNGIPFDDATNELSQEEADKNLNEFMFWRPKLLKDTVKAFIGEYTIFIDCLFTECILIWKGDKYERINNDRKVFEFNPCGVEKDVLDTVLQLGNKHVLIHVRQKKEGDSHTETDDFFQRIINWCNKKEITPILIGIEGDKYEGIFSDARGSNKLSFEGMAYLIDKCKVMLGNDSGFSAIKLYQQQKDNLLIMNYPRWGRHLWYDNVMKGSGNYKILNANEDNFEEITKLIEEYYERQ